MFADNIWLSGMSEKFVGHATGPEGGAAGRGAALSASTAKSRVEWSGKGEGPRNSDFRSEERSRDSCNVDVDPTLVGVIARDRGG